MEDNARWGWRDGIARWGKGSKGSRGGDTRRQRLCGDRAGGERRGAGQRAGGVPGEHVAGKRVQGELPWWNCGGNGLVGEGANAQKVVALRGARG